jgi:hypothetical protein
MIVRNRTLFLTMTNQLPPSPPKNRYPKRKNTSQGTPAPAAQDRRDLQVEIDSLRLNIDCMSERINDADTLTDQLRMLDVVSKAIVRLAALVKMQKEFSQQSEDYLAGLSRLLAETNEKLRREGVHK